MSKLEEAKNINLHEFKLKLKAIAYKYFYNFKGHKIFSAIISKLDLNELKKLSSNKNIIVCKPDKGRGVVLIDRETYVDKMMSIISDTLNSIELLIISVHFALKLKINLTIS